MPSNVSRKSIQRDVIEAGMSQVMKLCKAIGQSVAKQQLQLFLVEYNLTSCCRLVK